MSTTKILSTANNDFTVNMYQALYSSVSSQNLICSPFSLHAVLGMVAQGARGDTRKELLEGLQFTEKNDSIIAKSYSDVITGFQKRASPETFTLLTANRIYSRTGYSLNPAFVKTLKDSFQAHLEQMDFSTSGKCTAAAAKINKWVQATTKDKIKNLISSDALGPDTGLILVNAVYFKGFWKYKFKKTSTSKEPFSVSLKKKVNVDMMHIEEKFPYGKLPNLKAEAVCLPYRGGRLGMVIILPKDVDGLAKMKGCIGSILKGGKSLVKDSLKTTDRKVKLSLPKFRVETTIKNLEKVLKDLDIVEMFDEGSADFSGVFEDSDSDGNDPDLYVTSVIQKAFIEVNEEGAEAAAATSAVVMMPKGMSRRPIIPVIPFLVDRPFYFQIVDHANGDLVVFSGHINDPSV